MVGYGDIIDFFAELSEFSKRSKESVYRQDIQHHFAPHVTLPIKFPVN